MFGIGNRSLTEEPLPLFNGGDDEKQRRRSRCSSRPLSQDVTSLLLTSSISKGSSSGDTRAVIVKAPQIPAIFQNSVDNKLIKEPPSSSRRASAITAKIKVFEAEDSKEQKPQQAEGGMSSIKRLLQKESKQQGERKAETMRRFETPVPTSSNEGSKFFTVERSPSAGSNFNMSKVTNSQPSFLRKFFEKPTTEQAQQQQPKKKLEDDEEKIKKDQNEKDCEEGTINKEKSKTEEDPVLGLSVVEKATLFMKLEHEQRFSKWRKGTPTEAPSGFQSPVDKVIDQPSVKSSFPSHDRYPSTAPTPINLKDRRSVFESSRPPSCRGPCESSSYPRQTPIRTPFDPSDRRSVMEEFSIPIGWLPPDPSYFFSYPSNVFSPPVPMVRRRGSISDADLNKWQMGGYHGFPPPPPPYPFKCIPPHCHPPPPPPFFHPKQAQPPQVRGYRVRSLFVSGTSDHETHSEDGEVSSGGQEVAEIISKSYENSPIFRKKSWRSQKKTQQKVMTKELWHRCSQLQQQQDDTDINDVFYDARSEFEDFEKEKQHLPPPATSNLLPILTALSSSNDELDDGNNIKTNKPKISRKTLSISSQKTEVTVPQPDDESFHAFFKHARFPPLCPPPTQASKEKTAPAADTSNQNDFSSVKREADMLVMKKHVPLVRRKSSGKSKNPLKALAARFDFTNQKYTEVHTSHQ